MDNGYLYRFLKESNAIEGIYVVTNEDISATEDFLLLTQLTVADISNLVTVYTKGEAVIRDQLGMNVQVGPHRPPSGGQFIAPALEEILFEAETDSDYVYVHKEYETLHPYTDGNGRSGRALWLWMMLRDGKLTTKSPTFLQMWYYQTLQENRK